MLKQAQKRRSLDQVPQQHSPQKGRFQSDAADTTLFLMWPAHSGAQPRSHCHQRQTESYAQFRQMKGNDADVMVGVVFQFKFSSRRRFA